MPAAAESARPTVWPAPPTMSFAPPCCRRVTHRPGGRVHGDEHGPRDVAGHVEGQTVGALRLHACEESAAVQDRDAGGQYALLCDLSKPVAAESLPADSGTRTVIRSGPVPDIEATRTPSKSCAAMRFQLSHKAVQKRHRIDLCLLSQPHAAVERKWHIRALDPLGAHRVRRPGQLLSTDSAVSTPLASCA